MADNEPSPPPLHVVPDPPRTDAKVPVKPLAKSSRPVAAIRATTVTPEQLVGGGAIRVAAFAAAIALASVSGARRQRVFVAAKIVRAGVRNPSRQRA